MKTYTLSEPLINLLPENRLAGKRMKMSFAKDRTGELWRSFMPRRKEIGNAAGTALFSVQTYHPLHFREFDPHREFEKWAALEVTGFEGIPDGLETLTLPGGLYAVFAFRGPVSAAAEVFGHIFTVWLPGSPYALDDRPHFEVLGEKFDKDSPVSEEEIWIPVRLRTKQ